MSLSQALVAQPLRGLPTRSQWTTLCEAAKVLCQSGLLPRGIDTPQKAAAIILKGAELGIPPMHAFAHIAVIGGKPACSAELHLALLARGGVSWEWHKDGRDGEAVIVFHRPGFPQPFTGRFSLDEAKQAGLLSNPTWTKYQAAMLRARAITAGARLFGADLLAGMSYTPEELGVAVNEDGEVVEVEDATVRDLPDPDDIPFASMPEETRKELIKAIHTVEVGLALPAPHQTACRKKHAGTEHLEEATIEGLREYLARLLEYHKERAAKPA